MRKGLNKLSYRSPLDGQNIGSNGSNYDIALLQSGLIPQSAKLFEDVQVAKSDSALPLHIDQLVVRRYRQPGGGGVGEAGVLLIVPLEGSTHGVAGESLKLLLVRLTGLGIHGVLPANENVGHAQLLALVSDSNAGQDGFDDVNGVDSISSQASSDATLIVVAEYPVGSLSLGHVVQPVVDQLGVVVGVRIVVDIGQHFEVEGNLRAEMSAIAIVLHQDFQWGVGFSEQDTVIAPKFKVHLLNDITEGVDQFYGLRLVGGVDVLQVGVILWVIHTLVAGLIGPVAISICGHFENVGHSIDAESIGSLAQPEAQDILHRLHNLRVAVVEIRLLCMELVQIVGLTLLVPGPHIAAEYTNPVGGRLADAVHHLAGVPDIEVLVFLLAGCGSDEPVALIAGVVGHKIEDNLDVQFLSAGH